LEQKPEKQWTKFERRSMLVLEQRMFASPEQFSSHLTQLALDEPGAYLGLLARLLPPPLTNLNSPAMAAIIRSTKSWKVTKRAFHEMMRQVSRVRLR
jgi:hypothetical protein